MELNSTIAMSIIAMVVALPCIVYGRQLIVKWITCTSDPVATVRKSVLQSTERISTAVSGRKSTAARKSERRCSVLDAEARSKAKERLEEYAASLEHHAAVLAGAFRVAAAVQSSISAISVKAKQLGKIGPMSTKSAHEMSTKLKSSCSNGNSEDSCADTKDVADEEEVDDAVASEVLV